MHEEAPAHAGASLGRVAGECAGDGQCGGSEHELGGDRAPHELFRAARRGAVAGGAGETGEYVAAVDGAERDDGAVVSVACSGASSSCTYGQWSRIIEAHDAARAQQSTRSPGVAPARGEVVVGLPLAGRPLQTLI
jgi:hypothetical protein